MKTNIIKNKINDIIDLLFIRPMSYLMSEGDKCKNMFVKPLYFIACMIVLLFDMVILFGCGVLIFGLIIIISSLLLSPLNNYPDIQIAIFMGIILYGVCFYLTNFGIIDDED